MNKEVKEEKEKIEENQGGKIKISNEVISILAGVSATDVKGVAGMSGDLAGGIAEMLGRENLSKGVSVVVEEKEVTVDLYVIMQNNVKIHKVAREIQNNVCQTIEENTGLAVTAVNVNVQGVNFEQSEEAESKEEVDN